MIPVQAEDSQFSISITSLYFVLTFNTISGRLFELELIHWQVIALFTHLTQRSDAIVDVAFGLLSTWRGVLWCRRLRIMSRTQRWLVGVAANRNKGAGENKKLVDSSLRLTNNYALL
jgi:hypothetical protein